MLVSKKTQRQARLQGSLFLLLFVAVVIMLAWLSTRYSLQADWTASGRNSLSEASTSLLDSMPDDIAISSYATEDESVRRAVSRMVARYQRHKTNISLKFVNPDLEPDTVRDRGISVNGELVIHYQGREQSLKNLTEEGLTNALQRLSRNGDRWLIFLDGHGERKPQGIANHDLQQWGQHLVNKGFKTQSHNLAQNPQLPDNTRVLVIAGPQADLLPGEVKIISEYVEAGGNLLWLTDPGSQHGLEPLAKQLGIQFQAGMIVDPTTRVLGVNDPRFALVATYPHHAITQGFDTITLFPQAVALRLTPPAGWQGHSLLQTAERSWSETGTMSGSIRFDQGSDIAGPLSIGVALSRELPAVDDKDSGKQQRVVVIGDGDFLSNAYLGNGGNLALGNKIINWLAFDDQLITIPTVTATDKNLQLSSWAQGAIGIGFLFLLPLLLGGAGFFIWWQRRKR
jgi:ABC-type uncharacterized transport system involved in gliding motility auxiliary subunit